jgi:hypothetical protein
MKFETVVADVAAVAAVAAAAAAATAPTHVKSQNNSTSGNFMTGRWCDCGHLVCHQWLLWCDVMLLEVGNK